MARHIARRLALALLTFLAITAVTFAVVRLAPGDPVHAGSTADGQLTPETYARLRAHFHLDESLPKAYVRWLSGIARLDFGNSFHTGQPVRARILERLPATALPALTALGSALVGAILLGTWLAPHADTWYDRLIGALTLTAYSIPRYVMGMLLIVVVGVRLGWLPFVGTGAADAGADATWLQRGASFTRHGLLLVICLGYPLFAYLTRVVRAAVREALASDYIRTARAKGASMRRAVWRHALPNGLLPLLTLLGVLLPPLLGGTVILEVLFSWPGLGRLMYEAAAQRDYPVIMALTTFTAGLVLIATLVVDLLYAVVDPRVRLRT
jgi:peptide/nickel transport system permease protein